jgi:hypothetical protein
MSLWLDEKYLRFASPQLDRFAQKSPHLFNFRCPLCGDSAKIKSKSRGYCFAKGDVLLFKCHNCSVTLPFSALLKRVSRRLYDEYMLEKVREGGRSQRPSDPPPDVTSVPPSVASTGLSTYLIPLDRRFIKLPEGPGHPTHSAVEYAKSRKLPLDRLWATVHAHSWLTPLVGAEKAAKVIDGEVYLVIPLTLPDGDWYGAQLRLLSRKEYITYRWQNEPLKMFGLDHWSPTASMTTTILEGPFDSLFVPNGIAACSSDLMGAVRVMEAQKLLSVKDPRRYCWDNEPRNAEVVRLMTAAVRHHESIVIWPKGYPKDVNDMVLAGLDVWSVMNQRTFRGLRAELELSAWCG